MDTPIFFVYGNHGRLEVDAETGIVVSRDGACDCELCNMPEVNYGHIGRFDVAEWEATYPDDELVGRQIDILDLGYWWGEDETYEPPEYDWRAEFRPELDTVST